ncbi:hypothetical protein ACS0TY_022091 [Phlomoides rotata]
MKRKRFISTVINFTPPLNTMEEVESEVIDVDDIDEREKESCLVGRLVTEKHWNPSNLIQVITKAWNPNHSVSWKEWEDSNLILFRFDDVTDRDWVLKNQPWHFKGSLFAIKKFTGGNEPSPDKFTIEHASFWARLYDVPFSCMNEISITLFVKQIGILESIYTPGEDLNGKFIRFKVSMNITKPLLRGITIRFKGKHLWLPLKYELLPIYCFSCGTIGHDYNNCETYNCDLKYSTLKWKDAPATALIPHDIVENILSRLPVKYLLRYKVVCKIWEATISDPRFAETHLQQYKNSCSQNLLIWEAKIRVSGYSRNISKNDYSKFLVAEVEAHNIKHVSRITHSWKCPLRSRCILGNCDGLYLIRCFALHPEVSMCVVWNPSCRAYKEIWCPLSIDDGFSVYGIYYNALMKDYKVVIGDTIYYAVFSCRYNKWSEVKYPEDISWKGKVSFDKVVSVKGCFYWLELESVGHVFEVEKLICFDGKDEKFKKIPIPDCKAGQFKLISSGSHLYLWHDNCVDEIRMMRKDNKDSWMEFKVLLQSDRPPPQNVIEPYHLFWVSEDEILLYYTGYYADEIYMIYDLRKRTSVSFHVDPYKEFNHPVPYLENLFIQ